MADQLSFSIGTENPQAPTANFTFTTNGLTVNFDASSSIGEITEYQWRFEPEQSGSGVTTTYTFAAAGTYPVILTVLDDNGSGTITKNVTVSETSPPPEEFPWWLLGLVGIGVGGVVAYEVTKKKRD